MVLIDANTPPTVAAFIRQAVDLHFEDLHSILRLPLSSVGISAACNLTCAGALLNIVSGASVVLYQPLTEGNRGRLFRDCLKEFYPWNLERPSLSVIDPAEASSLLWKSFRNPLAHAFGQRASIRTASVSRYAGDGLSERALEIIEIQWRRPEQVFQGHPTMSRDESGHVVLNVEPFYWGVREMIRRLTCNAERMSAAEAALIAHTKKFGAAQ